MKKDGRLIIVQEAGKKCIGCENLESYRNKVRAEQLPYWNTEEEKIVNLMKKAGFADAGLFSTVYGSFSNHNKQDMLVFVGNK